MTFCSSCGAPMEETSAFCLQCGAQRIASTQPQQPPVYVQPPYGQPMYPQPVYYVKPKVPGRGFGISAMVLGIVGLFYGFYMFIASIAVTGFDEAGIAVAFVTLLYSSLSILAVSFAYVAKKRGYVNNVCRSGEIMGIIGLCLWGLSFFISLIAGIA